MRTVYSDVTSGHALQHQWHHVSRLAHLLQKTRVSSCASSPSFGTFANRSTSSVAFIGDPLWLSSLQPLSLSALHLWPSFASLTASCSDSIFGGRQHLARTASLAADSILSWAFRQHMLLDGGNQKRHSSRLCSASWVAVQDGHESKPGIRDTQRDANRLYEEVRV